MEGRDIIATAIGLSRFAVVGEGIGGMLKVRVADFRVDEEIKSVSLDPKGRFTVARISLTNWETNRFINRMAKTLRMSRDRIWFAGTKDKRAITRQLFVIDSRREKVAEVEIPDVEIEIIGRTHQKIGFGSHRGNIFTVVVRGCCDKNGKPLSEVDALARIEVIKQEMEEEVGAGQFPNWIGPQRFGANRPVTSLVGRHVVEGDFEGAVLTYLGMPLPLGVVTAIATGAICGLCSGTFIAKMKIPPFIATLGMMLILKGLSLVISGTRPIYFNDTPGFDLISRGSLIGEIIPALPIPNGVLILFIVAIVASYILSNTVLGRYTFALGSNEEAVRLSGVNTDRWKMAVYALAGGIVGIGGLLIASRLNSAQPALGLGYELEAIAAVVIGGTSLSGGRGTILGTLIGALIMAVLTNGLRVLSVAQEWQTVVTGVIIILAVYADMLRRRKV